MFWETLNLSSKYHVPLQDIIEAAFMITKPNDTWLPSDYDTAIAMMRLVGAHENSDNLETNLVVLTRSMSHLLSLAADCLVASYEVCTEALNAMDIMLHRIRPWLDSNADSARMFKAVNEACLIPLLERQLRFVYTLHLQDKRGDLKYQLVTEVELLAVTLFQRHNW
jgi:hypothetical protein